MDRTDSVVVFEMYAYLKYSKSQEWTGSFISRKKCGSSEEALLLMCVCWIK